MTPPKPDVLEVLDILENLYELQSTEIKRPAPPKRRKAGRLVNAETTLFSFDLPPYS